MLAYLERVWYSIYIREVNMHYLECKTCYVDSQYPDFVLCKDCAESIDQLKASGQVIKKFSQGPYSFQILKSEHGFKATITLSSRSEIHNTLAETFTNLKACEEGISLWLNRPFKMAGSMINIYD
jgi:hypothetical protein